MFFFQVKSKNLRVSLLYRLSIRDGCSHHEVTDQFVKLRVEVHTSLQVEKCGSSHDATYLLKPRAEDFHHLGVLKLNVTKQGFDLAANLNAHWSTICG